MNEARVYADGFERSFAEVKDVFEERTFEEMSGLNGLSEERCKGIYYYAIRKIRKVMGGEN